MTAPDGTIVGAAGAGSVRRTKVRWLLAWARERFPLRNAVFFAVFYVTGLACARAGVSGPLPLGWGDLPGFFAVWAFFLLLRVLDEHKDFAADAVAHPQRVLQRGLVTLADLRGVGVIAVALQLATSLWRDGSVGPVTRWWLVALGWSLLMAREFFVGAWLRKHIMLYALSHMAVMPLVVVWIASMGGAGAPRAVAVQALAALSFVAGLGFEMARKVRAPEDEHPDADSYTQSLGVRAATLALLLVLVATAAAALLVVRTAGVAVRPGVAAAVAAATLAGAAALAAFAARPTRAGARRVEGAVGVAVLVGQLVVLASLVAARGVVVR